MTNRAEIYNPLPVDMFTTLETGTRGTFTDVNAPAGYYIFTPDGGQPVKVHKEKEFNAYFKYYSQATIF